MTTKNVLYVFMTEALLMAEKAIQGIKGLNFIGEVVYDVDGAKGMGHLWIDGLNLQGHVMLTIKVI